MSTSTMSASPVKPVMPPPPPQSVPVPKVIPPTSPPTSNTTVVSVQNPVAPSPPKSTTAPVTATNVTSSLPPQNNSPSKPLQQNMNHTVASAVPLSLITTDHKASVPPTVQAVPATVQPLIINRTPEKQQSSNLAVNLKPTSNGVEGQPSAASLIITPVVPTGSPSSATQSSIMAHITPIPSASSSLPPPSVSFTPVNTAGPDQQKLEAKGNQPQHSAVTLTPVTTSAHTSVPSAPSLTVSVTSALSSADSAKSIAGPQHPPTGVSVSPVKVGATSHSQSSVSTASTNKQEQKVNSESSSANGAKAASVTSVSTPAVTPQEPVQVRPPPSTVGVAPTVSTTTSTNASITITKTSNSQTSVEPSSSPALSAPVSSSPSKTTTNVTTAAPAACATSSSSSASATLKPSKSSESTSSESNVSSSTSSGESSKLKTDPTTPAVPSTAASSSTTSVTPSTSTKSELKVATIPRGSKRKRETKPPPVVQASKVGTPVAQAQGSSSENESADDRKSKRVRLPTQPYQSPLPELTLIAKMNKITPSKANDDKLIVFYKNEFLAVRNAESGFYICQAMQNIYKSSPRIRIRWLSQEASTEVYSPDFYDTTDFDCILTNLNLERVEKEKFRLPPVELHRTESILKRALDVEKGVSEKPSVTEEHPDGLDLSLFRDESQLKKTPKKGSTSSPSVKRSGTKSARSSRSTSEVMSESEENTTSSDEKKKKKESMTVGKTNKKKKQSVVKKKSVPASTTKKSMTKSQVTVKSTPAAKKKKKKPSAATASSELPARATAKRKRSTSVPPVLPAGSSSVKRQRKPDTSEKTDEKSSKTRSPAVATPVASKSRSATGSSNSAETAVAASSTRNNATSSNASSTAGSSNTVKDNNNREQRRASKSRAVNK